LEVPPGSRWKYSGGGYTVMQQLLIDVSHQPFTKLLHDTVLAPIGVTRSTYEQPLPAALRSGAATPYNADGSPVEGGFHTYLKWPPPDCGRRPPISRATRSRSRFRCEAMPTMCFRQR
jgi:CubicO group peptidase (beta-lactamase class C family)